MREPIVTGIDLVETQRIAKSLRSPHFLERVFSQKEQALLQERAGGRPLYLSAAAVSTAAANFCAKEAFAKALGTGIRGFSLREVSALRDGLGRPYLELTGGALRMARERELSFSLSLTHTREYAGAVVVGWVSKK